MNATPEKIARGEHLAFTMCAACHTLEGDLPLTGGDDLFEDVPFSVGSAFPSNLTPAGRIADWSDGELVRAMREGADPDRHLLSMMALNSFQEFSEDGRFEIVAYLRSQPVVGSEVPRQSSLSTITQVMIAAGMFPVNELPDPEFPPAVPVGPTAEYGAYIAGYVDCAACHRERLTGSNSSFVNGPNLVTVKAWTAGQFITSMRTGVSPARGALTDEMPWEYIGLLDDEELTALYEYLRSLPY